MRIPGTISKAYSDVLFGIINATDELPEAIKKDTKWGMHFVFNNLMVTVEIDEIEKEIKSVLENLGVSGNYLIFRSYSIEQLTIGIKQYLIAWSTMKDLMANLINTSLELGIHEKDISFGMILRNEKVKRTNIMEICNKHSKSLDVSNTDRKRNEAIHRGKLIDEEVDKYRTKYNELFAQKYSLLNLNPISDEEFDKRLKELNEELTVLVNSKKIEYSEHLQLTINLNKELAEELAKLAAKILNNERI